MLYPIPVVRAIITDEEGRILILKRQNTVYYPGAWCLPGGKIHYGETGEQALARELQEETSLGCISSKFLFYQDSLPDEPGGMHCINLYFACAVSGDVIVNEESEQFAWIRPSDLQNYDIAFRNDQAILRYWQEVIVHPHKAGQ